MVVKKASRPRKAATARRRTWKDALREHLSKVPEVDAVFVNTASDTIHVYSIVAEFEDESCGKLLQEEAKVESAFPKVSFEFHTRRHQGRKPTESGPWGSELVYLR